MHWISPWRNLSRTGSMSVHRLTSENNVVRVNLFGCSTPPTTPVSYVVLPAKYKHLKISEFHILSPLNTEDTPLAFGPLGNTLTGHFRKIHTLPQTFRKTTVYSFKKVTIFVVNREEKVRETLLGNKSAGNNKGIGHRTKIGEYVEPPL